MYKVYVLRSQKSGKRYVGMTSQPLNQKLKEHNDGTGFALWTRGHRPYELVHSEIFETKTEALKRERFLKSGDGRRVLDIKLKV